MKADKPHILADAIIPRTQITVDCRYDHRTLTAEVTAGVTAGLVNRLATHMHEYIVDTMAANCDMSRREFMDFLHFLTHDPELKDRFIAHKTARRLRGG